MPSPLLTYAATTTPAICCHADHELVPRIARSRRVSAHSPRAIFSRRINRRPPCFMFQRVLVLACCPGRISVSVSSSMRTQFGTAQADPSWCGAVFAGVQLDRARRGGWPAFAAVHAPAGFAGIYFVLRAQDLRRLRTSARAALRIGASVDVKGPARSAAAAAVRRRRIPCRWVDRQRIHFDESDAVEFAWPCKLRRPHQPAGVSMIGRSGVALR